MTLAVQSSLFFRRKMLEIAAPAGLDLHRARHATALPGPLHAAAELPGGRPGFPPGHVLDVFVPGILVLIAFGAGMGAGWPVIWELDSGVIERLRVTPASRLALLLGTVSGTS